MKRERKKRYLELRQIRQERDYQIGKLQFANRPYSKPSISAPGGKRKVLTTKRFIEETQSKLNL